MVLNHETRAQGLIQSFNVEGVFVAQQFPIKHVTVTDAGSCYLLSLSGLIGNDSNGKLVSEELYPQAMQTLENIRTAIMGAAQHLNVRLERTDALSHITFSRADVSDLSQVLELNSAYRDAGMPDTSRAALEVRKLPLNAGVEITVTAALPK